MKYLFFLFPVLLFFNEIVRCGDTKGRYIPGMDDSLHYFDAADYEIIQTLPKSVGFRILSAKLDGTSNNRLLLGIELNKENAHYNFLIVYAGKNYHDSTLKPGRTIKPRQVSVYEKGKLDSMINRQLKYVIYGKMSEYSRVYLRLPDQDSVLLELPVRWRHTR